MPNLDRRQFVAAIGATGWGFASIRESLTAERHTSRRLLSRSDGALLADQERRVMDSAKLVPNQTRGKWKNQTPYTLHVPVATSGTRFYWIRDAVMMPRSEFIELPKWTAGFDSFRRRSEIVTGPSDPAWKY